MPMIHAETVRAVQQLLHDNGIEQRSGERLGDYVARGLGVSPAQAEAFLDALHDGLPVEQAQAAAGIPDPAAAGLLRKIAETVGASLGQLKAMAKRAGS